MPLSRYIKFYGCTGHDGCSLLFSTLKASLAIVPDEVVQAASRGEPIGVEYEETLRSLGMLVDDVEEERRSVFGYIDEINRVDPSIQVSIILNLRCNFACVYCYEGKQKSNVVMSVEVADQAVEFIKTLWREGKSELILHFYGGEPLMDLELIHRISKGLKPFAESKGADFKFSLVTNGSLLTPKVVEDLLQLGLDGVKVTLDGPRLTHDLARPYANGNGSFDRIVENVMACVDLVKIVISGNYTKDNYTAFPELISFLKSIDLGPERIGGIVFGPVMAVNDEFSIMEHTSGCCSVDEPWIVQASILHRRAILEQGFRAQKIRPSPCMADVTHSVTIHVDGSITKCPALIGHSRFEVGDVLRGTPFHAGSYNLNNWKHEGKCADCEYLPLCFGGCRYMQYQRIGTVAGVDCRKQFLDGALEMLLKLDIEYGNLD